MTEPIAIIIAAIIYAISSVVSAMVAQNNNIPQGNNNIRQGKLINFDLFLLLSLIPPIVTLFIPVNNLIDNQNKEFIDIELLYSTGINFALISILIIVIIINISIYIMFKISVLTKKY